jgi:phosphate starvation-inducible PhoH-like protein
LSNPQRTVHIDLQSERVILAIFGPNDTHRRLLERRLKVKLNARATRLSIIGGDEHVDFAQRVLLSLLGMVEQGQTIFLHELERVIAVFESEESPDEALDSSVGEESEFTNAQSIPRLITFDRRTIQPKTANQRRYLELISQHDITFGVGPAGTGKTYLAMACAIHALRTHEVKRIILTRPAVEAGERLGFLPGSLIEKVNPYLRPLYDAMYEMLGVEMANKAIEDKVIEVAPLAFMRGRTLNQAFVILDEAQNTTREQMKMFLTRIGYSSKAVITGDITQTDLGDRRKSGLAQALRLVGHLPGIAHMELTTADVVRHPLVRAIIKAYDKDDAVREMREAERRAEKETLRKAEKSQETVFEGEDSD